jgi:hypothetical protein
MYELPQFWLPIALPILFAFIEVAFQTLVAQRKYRNISMFLLRLSVSTCFACLAIDIWALTTAISTVPKTGVSTPAIIIAMAIIFFLLHMFIYALCLLAEDEYQATTQEKRFGGLVLPAWTTILGIIACFLVMFERIRVWQLFYA